MDGQLRSAASGTDFHRPLSTLSLSIWIVSDTKLKSRFYASSVAVAALLAFFLGRWSESRKSKGDEASLREQTGLDEQASDKSRIREARSATSPQRKIQGLRISVSEAMALTPAERLERLTRGALIYNGTTQSIVLCNLIEALTKEEMDEATRLLGRTQDQGNAFSQQVWDTLWMQWGRLDPEGCLAGFSANPQGKPESDTRNVMKGWLEFDPDAALAWAMQPRTNGLEAAAAAEAIAYHSSGDPEKMKTFLGSFPPGSSAIKACFHDYFDLAGFKAAKGPAELYEELPPTLQERAWPVALQRLGYSNPEAAAAWLVDHAGEPGADYQAAYRFVAGLSQTDPAGTAEWTARLPVIEPSDETPAAEHPASVAVSHWMNSDREAALRWLEGQPSTAPWVVRYRSLLDER